MKIHTAIAALRADLAAERRLGRSIGLVPTMGALHDGHRSLLRTARQRDDVVVGTIFVNPTQFGPSEDFDRYPRSFEADAAVMAADGADYLFAPSVAEMYPVGVPATTVQVGPIGEVGEGRWRPGFLTAVATVCVKLFSITTPDRAYFGEKDAQQLATIRQVVADLDLPLAVVGCPTVREPDGLARSSRNAYLTREERRAAPALARGLFAARSAARAGERDAAALTRRVADEIASEPAFTLQYVEVFDAARFVPLGRLDAPAILAAAAHLGGTRLIDNVALEVAAEPAGTAPGAAPRAQ
ncbi:MAG TPA: pantoate--beta-alanine ligase [Actinomycetota bacterium]|nr:pantoate--beta-alanine ligase [Actinomycetota bacterium]